MASSSSSDPIVFETRGKIAIITINQEKKLNALNQDLYFKLAQLLHKVAAMDEIFVTVLTGKGRFFSAGADVTISRATPSSTDAKRHWLQSFVANNLHITHAFYTHPKILITALNGPAIGLSAALIAFSDFIYAAPHAYLLTPFTSLGLVAEGGASRAFVQRLGIAKANEALIMSKRIPISDLVSTGFVNAVFDEGSISSVSSSTGNAGGSSTGSGSARSENTGSNNTSSKKGLGDLEDPSMVHGSNYGLDKKAAARGPSSSDKQAADEYKPDDVHGSSYGLEPQAAAQLKKQDQKRQDSSKDAAKDLEDPDMIHGNNYGLDENASARGDDKKAADEYKPDDVHGSSYGLDPKAAASAQQSTSTKQTQSLNNQTPISNLAASETDIPASDSNPTSTSATTSPSTSPSTSKPTSKAASTFDSSAFLQRVLAEIDDKLGDHLNPESMIKVKALIRLPERDVLDRQGVLEVFGGLERFVAGVPQEEFRKIAAGEKRHKL